MKTFKNLFRLFLLLVFMAGFVSCGDHSDLEEAKGKDLKMNSILLDLTISEPGGNGKIYDVVDDQVTLVISSEPGGNGKVLSYPLLFDADLKTYECETFKVEFYIVLEIPPGILLPNTEYIVENPCLKNTTIEYSKEDGSFKAGIEAGEGQYLLVYAYETKDSVLFIDPIHVDY